MKKRYLLAVIPLLFPCVCSANSYYNHGSVPAYQGRIDSSEIRNEFDSIQDGFTDVETDINDEADTRYTQYTALTESWYGFISLDGKYSCDLAAAITDIGSTPTNLVCDCAVTVTSGTTATLNADTTWNVSPGCVASGVSGGGVETLNISKINNPGNIYWIGEDLTVKASAGAMIGESYASWWGAFPGGDSTLNAYALNQAGAFFSNLGGGTVKSFPGTYGTAATVVPPAGTIYRGFTSGGFITARTVIKPDVAVSTAIQRTMAGNVFGFGFKNIDIDMDSMAAGSTAIEVISDRHFDIDDVSVYNLNNNTTTALKLSASVAGGVYYGHISDFVARDGAQAGIGIALVGVSTDITHLQFDRPTLSNLYDGMVADNCGTGIEINSMQNTAHAHNGITITNQSANTSISVNGGEIGGMTGVGVDGPAYLKNVKMSGNGTDLANGAYNESRASTSGIGAVTTTGLFRPEQLGVGQGALQTLGATDSVDPTTDGSVIPVASSGGAVTLTSNPQIDNAVVAGQLVILKGTDNTNYPVVKDGQGLRLSADWDGKLDEILMLYYDASSTDWTEISRSSN